MFFVILFKVREVQFMISGSITTFLCLSLLKHSVSLIYFF